MLFRNLPKWYKKPKKKRTVFLPWQFLKFGRRPRNFLKRSKGLKPKKFWRRKRFTKKQWPIRDLFFLNAPWRYYTYYPKKERRRLNGHIIAFCSYYKLDENLVRRLMFSLKKKPNRVFNIFLTFETLLYIVLFRIGWARNIETAQSLVKNEKVYILRKINNKKVRISASLKIRLLPGDKIIAEDKSLITNRIKAKASKEYWRLSTRSLYPYKKPKGFDRKAFIQYKRAKRKRAWSRFLKLFLHHPSCIIANYNTLCLIYKGYKATQENKSLKYPGYFGKRFFFWKELIRAFHKT